MTESYICKNCKSSHDVEIDCPSCKKTMKRSLSMTKMIYVVLILLFCFFAGLKFDVDFAVKEVEQQCNEFLLERHGMVRNLSFLDLAENELLLNVTKEINGTNVSRYTVCSSSIGCDVD